MVSFQTSLIPYLPITWRTTIIYLFFSSSTWVCKGSWLKLHYCYLQELILLL